MLRPRPRTLAALALTCGVIGLFSERMIEQLAQLRGEVLGHAGVAGGPDEPHRRAGFDLVAYFG